METAEFRAKLGESIRKQGQYYRQNVRIEFAQRFPIPLKFEPQASNFHEIHIIKARVFKVPGR
jgi:hypothetical protein